MNEQQSLNLDRVRSKIATVILSFCAARMGEEFHMEELARHVSVRVEVSPDSPSRILRDLRRRGELNYEVVRRSESLYRVLPLEKAEAA